MTFHGDNQFPCCWEGEYGESRCNNMLAISNCNGVFGEVGPEGLVCERAGGCWACEPEGGIEIQQGFCFTLPNGEKAWRLTWPSNCNRCNAMGHFCEPIDTQAECEAEPEIPPSGCRMATDDRAAPDGRQWTVDLLGTVGFGLDEVIHPDGYARTLSSEMVRAKAEPTSVADPCGHVASELVVLSDGYVYGEVCSQPQWDRSESRRRSYAILRTAEDTPSMENGYQYAIASIQLPSWTEITYRSHKVFCEPFEE